MPHGFGENELGAAVQSPTGGCGPLETAGESVGRGGGGIIEGRGPQGFLGAQRGVLGHQGLDGEAALGGRLEHGLSSGGPRRGCSCGCARVCVCEKAPPPNPPTHSPPPRGRAHAHPPPAPRGPPPYPAAPQPGSPAALQIGPVPGAAPPPPQPPALPRPGGPHLRVRRAGAGAGAGNEESARKTGLEPAARREVVGAGLRAALVS